MPNKPRNYKREFEAVMDALAQSIENASDEEILQDAIAAGENPEADARNLKDILLKSIQDSRQQRLRDARNSYQTAVRTFQSEQHELPVSPEEQRGLLSQVFTARPQMRDVLTAQHRNFEDLTDADVDACLKKLAALGVLKDVSK
jgi:DNA-binding ferritin-like protein (Dps family)